MFLNPPPPPKKYNLAKKCRSKKKHGSGPVSESAHGCSRHHQVAGVHVLQPIHAKSKVTSWNPTVFNVVGSGGFPRFGGKPPSLGQITRGFFVVKKMEMQKIGGAFFWKHQFEGVLCVFGVEKAETKRKGWERNDLEMKLLGFETSLQSQSDGILTPLMALKSFRPDPALQKILKISTFL